MDRRTLLIIEDLSILKKITIHILGRQRTESVSSVSSDSDEELGKSQACPICFEHISIYKIGIHAYFELFVCIREFFSDLIIF